MKNGIDSASNGVDRLGVTDGNVTPDAARYCDHTEHRAKVVVLSQRGDHACVSLASIATLPTDNDASTPPLLRIVEHDDEGCNKVDTTFYQAWHAVVVPPWVSVPHSIMNAARSVNGAKGDTISMVVFQEKAATILSNDDLFTGMLPRPLDARIYASPPVLAVRADGAGGTAWLDLDVASCEAILAAWCAGAPTHVAQRYDADAESSALSTDDDSIGTETVSIATTTDDERDEATVTGNRLVGRSVKPRRGAHASSVSHKGSHRRALGSKAREGALSLVRGEADERDGYATTTTDDDDDDDGSDATGGASFSGLHKQHRRRSRPSGHAQEYPKTARDNEGVVVSRMDGDAGRTEAGRSLKRRHDTPDNGDADDDNESDMGSASNGRKLVGKGVRIGRANDGTRGLYRGRYDGDSDDDICASDEDEAPYAHCDDEIDVGDNADGDLIDDDDDDGDNDDDADDDDVPDDMGDCDIDDDMADDEDELMDEDPNA